MQSDICCLKSDLAKQISGLGPMQVVEDPSKGEGEGGGGGRAVFLLRPYSIYKNLCR